MKSNGKISSCTAESKNYDNDYSDNGQKVDILQKISLIRIQANVAVSEFFFILYQKERHSHKI